MTTTKKTYQGRVVTITDTIVNGIESTDTHIDGVKVGEHLKTGHSMLHLVAHELIDADDPRLPELGVGRRQVTLDYHGRAIVARRCLVDGFAGVAVTVNGRPHWTYGPMSNPQQRTIAGAVAQARRDIDAVDERAEAAHDAHMYRMDDPRRAAVLARLSD